MSLSPVMDVLKHEQLEGSLQWRQNQIFRQIVKDFVSRKLTWAELTSLQARQLTKPSHKRLHLFRIVLQVDDRYGLKDTPTRSFLLRSDVQCVCVCEQSSHPVLKYLINNKKKENTTLNTQYGVCVCT